MTCYFARWRYILGKHCTSDVLLCYVELYIGKSLCSSSVTLLYGVVYREYFVH